MQSTLMTGGCSKGPSSCHRITSPMVRYNAHMRDHHANDNPRRLTIRGAVRGEVAVSIQGNGSRAGFTDDMQ
jgi:hypothetical protein